MFNFYFWHFGWPLKKRGVSSKSTRLQTMQMGVGSSPVAGSYIFIPCKTLNSHCISWPEEFYQSIGWMWYICIGSWLPLHCGFLLANLASCYIYIYQANGCGVQDWIWQWKNAFNIVCHLVQSNSIQTFKALNLQLLTDSLLDPCRTQPHSPLTICLIAVELVRHHSTYTSYGILVEPTYIYCYDILVELFSPWQALGDQCLV